MEGFSRSLQPMLMPSGIGIVVVVVLAVLLMWGAGVLFQGEAETIKSARSGILKAMWVILIIIVVGALLGALAMGTNYIPRNDVDKSDVYNQMESNVNTSNQ